MVRIYFHAYIRIRAGGGFPVYWDTGKEASYIPGEERILVLTVLYDESGILWYVVIWHILSYVI
jgi:hypothetical protein